MTTFYYSRSRRKHTRSAAATLLLALCAAEADALTFEFGDIAGRFDTVLTAGASVRTESRSPELVGTDNGGSSDAALNADDGNLNYDKGKIVSAPVKATHDLEFTGSNWGALVRASYFYDAGAAETERTELPRSGRHDFRLLDAYIYGKTDVAGRPVQLRLGQQVISWGEDIFTSGGINAINAVDVAVLRKPGAILKEAFLPSPAANLEVGLSDMVQFQTYYQVEWVGARLDPVGSYFSVSDVTGPSRRGLYFPGFGGDLGPAAVPHRGKEEPSDTGQFGVALRWQAAGIETDFGFYYIRTYSKYPSLGADFALVPLDPSDPGSPLTPSPIAIFENYKSDIDVFGVSFAKVIGEASVGGELSYRPNDFTGIDAFSTFFANGAASLVPGQVVTDDGAVEEQRWQAILNGVRIFKPSDAYMGEFVGLIGATTFTTIAEISAIYYPSLSDAVVFDAPVGRTVDDLAWIYTIDATATYSGLGGGDLTLAPQVSFTHEFSGTSPNRYPVEGRKSLRLALNYIYRKAWKGDVGYSMYFGAGAVNDVGDRDYVSTTLTYSF